MAKGDKKVAKSHRSSNPSENHNKKTQSATTARLPESQISEDIQQSCLTIFRDALDPSDNDAPLIQEVKGHLFNRDFSAAFGKEHYLRVYASRWSPNRALGYLQILTNLTKHIWPEDTANGQGGEHALYRVVCLGGGAGGELVALAAWLHTLTSSTSQDASRSLQIDLVDSADWSKIIEKLHEAVVKTPELSPYASQAKKDANRALLQREEVSVNFHQLDVLDADQMGRFEDLANADLVTCMFTLNELYGTFMAKTQQFLSGLTKTLRPGSCLLIVDSPGSYSTVSLNGSEKKYPMQWLLDYTLRGAPGKDIQENVSWERLESDDSQWFRRAQDLQYPIDLEDMRYQLHLYRKSDTGGEGNHPGG